MPVRTTTGRRRGLVRRRRRHGGGVGLGGCHRARSGLGAAALSAAAARTASRTLAAAEASNGASRISGRAIPSKRRSAGAGSRSGGRSVSSSTARPERRGWLPGEGEDAEPPHLDLSGQRRRRGRFEAPGGGPDIDLVVGDQDRAAIDQPEREIRLAAPRRAEQENPFPVDGDAARMDQRHRSPRRQAHGEARAGDAAVPVIAVGRRDRAAMGLHDLPRNREPQPGMAAELLARGALAVETARRPSRGSPPGFRGPGRRR